MTGPLKPQNKIPWKYIFLSIFLLFSLSCSLINIFSNKENNNPQVDFKLGESITVSDGNISEAGGIINITSEGGAFNGTEIQIPRSAFVQDTNFHFSYREVNGHNLGGNFTALTSMFELDFEGNQPEQYITIKVPVQIPEGYFALAFHYDPATGEFEGMPLISESPDSLTFVAKRFSDFIIGAVKETALEGDLLTSFEQGRDNFHIPNISTYTSPDGMCAGQSLAAIYFNEQNTGETLFQSFDSYNTGYKETPDLWQDDAMLIKLTSLAHTIVYDGDRVSDRDYWYTIQSDNPKLTYLTLSTLMLLTEKPQLFVLTNEKDSHAVVAYQKKGSSIYIYDPNSPLDNDTKISFDLQSSTFNPYISGLVSTGPALTFDHFYYLPKRDAISWEGLGSLWNQFLDGQFKNDPYPPLRLKVFERDPQGNKVNETTMANGFKTSKAFLEVFHLPVDYQAKLTVWRTEPGADPYNYKVAELSVPDSTPLQLAPGDNYYGFLLEKVDNNGKLTWIGFEWINIQQVDETSDQAPTDPQTNEQTRLSLEECDLTAYLTLEMNEASLVKYQDNASCTNSCGTSAKLINSSDETMVIYVNQFAFARDALGWRGERWNGFRDVQPGNSVELIWKHLYPESEACQWVDQGISRVLAIREGQGCDWLEDYYNAGFENSGIQFLEIPKPCP